MPEHDDTRSPGRGDSYPERNAPWPLLERYLSGECTAAECVVVEAWAAEDAAHAALLETLRSAVGGFAPQGPSRFDARAARRRMEGVLRARANDPVHWDAGRRPRRLLPAWAMRAAAGIAIIVGSIALWRAGWLAPGQQFREFVSAPGGRTTITLRDGTRLVLGPATHLRVPGDFGVASRHVELDGEALFTVVHDARRPFTVQTDRTIVRDVGTTFVVRAYAEDRDAQVAVAEGTVAIPGVTLNARDLAMIDSAGRVTVWRTTDVSRYLGFAQGALVFKDTPLREAARDLARTYNLDVVISDTGLVAYPVTAAFRDEPVDVVLDVVTRAVGAHYERTGRVVHIRRGVVPAADPGRVHGAELRVSRAGGGR